MLESSRSICTLSLLIVALILIATIFALPTTIVDAENTSVIVDLRADSMFDAFDDVFAYTCGNSMHVVKNNQIFSLPDAFVGTCIGFEINATNILLLAKNGSQANIYYFEYGENGIKPANQKLGALGSLFAGIFKDATGQFYLCRIFSSTIHQIKFFQENTDVNQLQQLQTMDPNNAISDYAYVPLTTNLYTIIDGSVYVANAGDPITSPENPFVKITDITDAVDLTTSADEIIVSARSGIYKIDPATNAATKLLSTTNSGHVAITTIKTNKYVFVCGSSAITQYLYNGTTCEYYNKFNNSKYVPPATFDLVYVAKSKATEINLYSSPRNMQIASTLSNGDYFMVLCKATNEDSGEYYYIVKADGTKGYIKSDASFDRIEPNKDVKSFAIGQYAQGLHASTNIYRYPYSGSEVLTTVSIYDELVVIDNVAEQDGTQVWDYYTVSYVKGGEIITGYVEKTDVSQYTALKPPTILKTVKISSGSIGSLVYLYVLPSEDSAQVAALTDGTELDLAEEYNKNSTWTKVVYNDTYAYVKTSQISQKGLTAVQITLIVISSVVVVASVVMLVIMKKKRKIGF